MTRLPIILFAAALGLGACMKTKAPGTNPSDMTAQQHRDECMKHKQIAAAYEKREKELHGGKGTYTAQYTKEEHEDVAKQHEDAAKAVDPNVEKCEVPASAKPAQKPQ